MISTDVIVVGGGCVGLTAAIGLAQQGIKVTLLDGGKGTEVLDAPEARVSAISPASEAVFKNLGVWALLDESRITPYQDMTVWEKESFGKIEFNAKSVSQPRLGHIIENANIRNALIKKAEQLDNLNLMLSTRYQAVHNGEENVMVSLENGTPIIAKLLIAADGGNSSIRKSLNMPITFSDYDHHAIVTTIKTELPHQHNARQVFMADGPLALLPLFQDNLCSIVWSTEPDNAKDLMALSNDDFAKALTAASDSVLGPVEVLGQRHSFNLTMRYANTWLQDRVVLMGDAAHTIHPLAGLGMNLGLLDAASLIQVLSEANSVELTECRKYLRQYERWRKAEAQQVIVAMQSLKSLFSGENPIKKLIRGTGLSLTNSLPLAKDQIILNAMGMKGDLPQLAKIGDPI